MTDRTKAYPLKARSHVLRLLGDELIGDDRLAVFELVKNGYDADARHVSVTLDVDTDAPRIVVSDDGYGMNLDDITSKWLVLGTDSKRGSHRARSPEFERLPLGEKGVGRLAASKLGDELLLNSRRKGHAEVRFRLNWRELAGAGDFVDQLYVDVEELDSPEIFEEGDTGTQIVVSSLRRTWWTRGDIRALYRLITSLASPFDTPDAFTVSFAAPGRDDDYADMLTPNEFLEFATWKFDFSISRNSDDQKSPGTTFCWKYEFRPPNWKGLKAQSKQETDGERLRLIPLYGERASSKTDSEKLTLGEDQLNGIGPITGSIFAYYRRPEVLKTSGNTAQLKGWLADQAGVRVYRDGVRVFNYGEPQDDWLGLNAKRVNSPTAKLGAGSVVANVNLRLEYSHGLKEKTNREGFEQGPAFDEFHRICNSVFERFGQLHRDDRATIDRVLKGKVGDSKKESVTDTVSKLKVFLKNHERYPEIKEGLESIENHFEQVRDVMVSAGMAGLNLAVVFHEVERSLDILDRSAKQGADLKELQKQIEHVQALLNTFSPLLKKNPIRNIFATEIIRAAMELREVRFKHHGIVTSAPILVGEEPDFRIRGAANLLVGALANLLDNSIYWSRLRFEQDGEDPKHPPCLQVRTNWNDKDGSGFIAVVDNGPGFTIGADRAFAPFVSERPGGMGLGLFFANLVMEQIGGMLSVHSAEEFRDEMNLSDPYDGAAVVLRFGFTS